MARIFNFRSLVDNITSKVNNGTNILNDVASKFNDVTSKLDDETYSLILEYKNKIAAYRTDKYNFIDVIGMIDYVLSELNSINKYIDNVKINKEKYDKDEIEGMISSLDTVRSNLETFVTNCNNEIEKLEGELSLVENSGGN